MSSHAYGTTSFVAWLMLSTWSCARWPSIQMPLPDGAAAIVIEGTPALAGARWKRVIQQARFARTFSEARPELVARSIGRADRQSGREPRHDLRRKERSVDFQRTGDAHPETSSSAQSIRDHSWFGKLTTRGNIDVRAGAIRRSECEAGRLSRGTGLMMRHVANARPFASQPALVSPPGMPPTSLPCLAMYHSFGTTAIWSAVRGASKQSATADGAPSLTFAHCSLRPLAGRPSRAPALGPGITGPISRPPGSGPVAVSEAVQVGPRSNADPIEVFETCQSVGDRIQQRAALVRASAQMETSADRHEPIGSSCGGRT
jgi:hypothetical protein